MIGRILNYYKRVVEIESERELTIENYFSYPICYKEDTNNRVLLVDLEQNEDFLSQYNQNSQNQYPQNQYPQNLYVGFNFLYKEDSYRLFNTIIEYNELNQFVIDNKLNLKIANFELNVVELERLEIKLNDSVICELNRVAREHANTEDIVDALKKFLNTSDIRIEQNVYLALCSNNIALSQILSELRGERLRDCIQNNTLSTEFITNSQFKNKIDEVDVEDLIRVSSLDDYQLNAIKFALENRLSVITGPPGTGKTQVILNLLANCLVRNKKVLVVSKNNKAIENVKERFDAIDSHRYLLRFGKQNLVERSTIPEIERLYRNENHQYDDSEFLRLQTQYNSSKHIIRIAKNDLAKILYWKNKILEYEQEIKEIEIKQNKIRKSKDIELGKLDEEYLGIRELVPYTIGDYSTDINILRNIVQEKFEGFFGFLYNFFCVKKYARILLNKIEQYPTNLREYIWEGFSNHMIRSYRHRTDLYEAFDWVIGKLNNILRYKSKKEKIESDCNVKLNGLENEKYLLKQNLTSILNEYNRLIENEPNNRQRIEQERQTIRELSIPLMNAYMIKNIINANKNNINTYCNSIPNNWRNGNLRSLTESFLDAFKLNCVTSLSVKNAFPLLHEIFDIIIVDEASQCDIASTVPLVARTKQLVVIGDPQQLKHISAVSRYEENKIKMDLGLNELGFLSYVRNSLWDYCFTLLSNAVDGMNQPYRLNNHYRCHSDIIGYSNRLFYADEEGGLNILTNIEEDDMRMGIHWIDIKGEQAGDNKRVNKEEAEKAVTIALMAHKNYPNKSIGIVTPFRMQSEYIYNLVRDQNHTEDIVVSTVHKYQGDEKDIIIFSLMVTYNTPKGTMKWIDSYNKYLVNVAVSRAKKVLCIVGNKEYIKENSEANGALGSLVRYEENLRQNRN